MRRPCLACGVFGNASEADIRRTVACCAGLCVPGGTVIWTRGRTEPDLVPRICEWFVGQGFERAWLSGPGVRFGVGVHTFAGPAQPAAAGVRMFTFEPPGDSR